MVTHSRSASPCRLKARRGLPSRSLRGGETRSLALTLSHACMATRSHMATLCVLLPPALPCSLRALSPRPLVACCTVPAELVHQWCEHSSFASRPLDCWSLGIAPPYVHAAHGLALPLLSMPGFCRPVGRLPLTYVSRVSPTIAHCASRTGTSGIGTISPPHRPAPPHRLVSLRPNRCPHANCFASSPHFARST